VLDDLDVRVVGITQDPEDSSAMCFVFQRSLGDASEQDRQLGLTTYEISDELGLSAYGALDSYELTANSLLLTFDDE
jgi:hypothetical protein